MKLIERLAEEASDGNQYWNYDVVEAYKAGFMKAREMAAEECAKEGRAALKKADTIKVDGFITFWLNDRKRKKVMNTFSLPVARLSYRVRNLGEEEV